MAHAGKCILMALARDQAGLRVLVLFVMVAYILAGFHVVNPTNLIFNYVVADMLISAHQVILVLEFTNIYRTFVDKIFA